MKISNRNKLFLIVGLGLICGLALPFSNPLLFLLLAFSSMIVGVISLLQIIRGLFSSQFFKWGFAGLLSVGIFIGVGLGLSTIIRNHRQDVCRTIIDDIEKFKMENGHYPQNLQQTVITNRIRGLKYSSDGSKFHIEYLMDGFNRQFYDSKTNAWGTLGWND